MNYLWNLEASFFKEIKAQFPEPKPATTTINTVIKRLIDKGYIDYKVYGNSREYFPLVSKNKYFAKEINEMIENYFDNSIAKFGSFFTKSVDINESEYQELKKIIENQIKAKDP